MSVLLAAMLLIGQAQADEPSEETVSAAAEASVAVEDLLGAMNSTGLAARPYLVGVGELAAPVPPITGAVTRADCIIGKESGGLDVQNRQGSGASGPGQYFPGTWASHVALYRRATDYAGNLSMHSLADVRRVMAYVLTLPGMRAAWTVGGC